VVENAPGGEELRHPAQRGWWKMRQVARSSATPRNRGGGKCARWRGAPPPRATRVLVARGEPRGLWGRHRVVKMQQTVVVENAADGGGGKCTRWRGAPPPRATGVVENAPGGEELRHPAQQGSSWRGVEQRNRGSRGEGEQRRPRADRSTAEVEHGERPRPHQSAGGAFFASSCQPHPSPRIDPPRSDDGSRLARRTRRRRGRGSKLRHRPVAGGTAQ